MVFHNNKTKPRYQSLILAVLPKTNIYFYYLKADNIHHFHAVSFDKGEN